MSQESEFVEARRVFWQTVQKLAYELEIVHARNTKLEGQLRWCETENSSVHRENLALEAEIAEQARLLGKSGSKEASLLAILARERDEFGRKETELKASIVMAYGLLDRALERMQLINGPDSKCICNPHICENHTLINDIQAFRSKQEGLKP